VTEVAVAIEVEAMGTIVVIRFVAVTMDMTIAIRVAEATTAEHPLCEAIAVIEVVMLAMIIVIRVAEATTTEHPL
jgi:hypothetical protein